VHLGVASPRSIARGNRPGFERSEAGNIRFSLKKSSSRTKRWSDRSGASRDGRNGGAIGHGEGQRRHVQEPRAGDSREPPDDPGPAGPQGEGRTPNDSQRREGNELPDGQ